MLLNRRKVLKTLSVLALILNTVSVIYGLFYIMAPDSTFLLNFFGVLFLMALTVNIILVYFNDLWGAAGKLSLFGTVYQVVFIAAVFLMWAGGLAASAVYERSTTMLFFYTMLYPGYFMPLILGFIHALLTHLSMNGKLSATSRHPIFDDIYNLTRGKKIILVILFLILLPGFFYAYILLSDLYLGLMQILVSQYALFWAFLYFAVALLILKIYPKERGILRYFTGAAGFAMFAVFLMPLFLMPGAVSENEQEFAAVFGENWQENIDAAYEEHLTPRKYSIPAYFLGIPPGDYRYEKDNLYYEGTRGIDEGIRLYYDVYMPPENSAELPGYGSTVIRIHGGAWMAGSKGAENMMPVNKHLAAQGYTVFDIQYGLTDVIDLLDLNRLYDFIGFFNRIEGSEVTRSISALGAPEHVVASFTLDDMVRHLGIFTLYLEENAGKYGANLDSVFISGGSAGGHLTTAMALAMSGGDYDHIFSPELQIRGYVPIYPGNKTYEIFEVIGGAREWQDVELLVKEDSPPSLIYQGDNDGMVPPETSCSFQERYLEAGNKNCVVISLPKASHASDFHFSGYYNQLFLYYMDRFLLLHK